MSEARMPLQMRDRRAFGILLLVLAWLSGVGALNLGVLKEGADFVAILGLLIACALWFFAHRLLNATSPGGRVAAIAMVLFWILNIGFAAVVEGSSVYKTPFFAVSLVTTVLLLVFVGVQAKLDAKRRSLNQ